MKYFALPGYWTRHAWEILPYLSLDPVSNPESESIGASDSQTPSSPGKSEGRANPERRWGERRVGHQEATPRSSFALHFHIRINVILIGSKLIGVKKRH